MMSIDHELERAIDAAGREAVFARARALGWAAGSDVPKWVWRQIAHDVQTGVPLQLASPPPRLDEALLGFRLF